VNFDLKYFNIQKYKIEIKQEVSDILRRSLYICMHRPRISKILHRGWNVQLEVRVKKYLLMEEAYLWCIYLFFLI